MRSENQPNGRSFIEGARRRQILDGAAVVIAGSGLAQASLARIGQEIGVSKGGVLYHFPDKSTLVLHLVLDIYRRGAAAIATAVEAAGDDARDQLGAYLRGNLTFTATHRTETVALVELSSSFRSREGLRLDEVMEHWMRRPDRSADDVAMLSALDLAALLRRGIERDELRSTLDPGAVATALRGAIDAAAGRATREPDFDPELYGRHLADLADHACRSTP